MMLPSGRFAQTNAAAAEATGPAASRAAVVRQKNGIHDKPGRQRGDKSVLHGAKRLILRRQTESAG